MRSAPIMLVAALVLACGASSYGQRQKAGKALEQGRVDEAVQIREELKASHPASSEVRLELGEAYYRAAREALDKRQFDAYERNLGLALDEFVEAARLDPASPSPHTWMGIVLAYQSNLPQALESFKNARKLDSRNPIHYTNIAQIYIYQGELVKGRHWLGLGKRLGAPPVIVELNETLAAWRSGDLVEAEDLFETAYSLDPKQVNNWDEAPVADPIENFEDFTAYCCSNPSCGPHMEKGCRKLDLAVKEREVRDETLRKEMVLEMERRRKLQEIYRGRKDLEVEIEPPEPSDKPR